jgi:hypothetical protein
VQVKPRSGGRSHYREVDLVDRPVKKRTALAGRFFTPAMEPEWLSQAS